MMRIRIALTLLAAFVVSGVAAQQVQTPETLLGGALHQEEVEGNLEAAIETYEMILAGPSMSRYVASRVLLHIGFCYEKASRQRSLRSLRRLCYGTPPPRTLDPDRQRRRTVTRMEFARLLDEFEGAFQAAHENGTKSVKPPVVTRQGIKQS